VLQDRYPNDPNRGSFAFEAEHFAARDNRSQKADWVVFEGELEKTGKGEESAEAISLPPPGGAQRGCFIRTVGHNAPGKPGSVEYDGPTVTYKVNVTAPGRYRLYARWSGRDGNTDSFYAQVIDPLGYTPPGPEYFLYHGRSINYYGSWVWDCVGLKDRTTCACAGRPDVAEWEITTPGVYTIRLSARETVTSVDALVFQTTNIVPPGKETGEVSG
jgi:hypothetical protein